MTFEEEKQLFYRKVVEAIGGWNGVELHLGIFFAVLLTGEVEKKIDPVVSRIYCAIQNFRSKLQVVDTVAEQILKDELLKQWKNIEKHIGKRASKRNSIIHGNFYEAEPHPSGKRIWIAPPALMQEPYYVPIFIHDLETAQSEFRSLSREISELIDGYQSLV